MGENLDKVLAILREIGGATWQTVSLMANEVRTAKIASIICCVITAAFGAFVACIGARGLLDKEAEHTDPREAIRITYIVVGAIVLFFSVAFAIDSIEPLCAPHYHVILKLLGK